MPEFIFVVCEFYSLYFEVWAWFEHGLASSGAPITHRASMLSLVGHVHHGRYHVHGMGHEGRVLSRDWSLRMLTLKSVKHHVARCALSVLTNVCVALLWRLVLRLFMCLFEQHDRRCKHVSFSLMLQRLHCGEVLCLSTCVLW